MKLLLQPSLSPTYRPDIDGLRAVAVLAVVAFHTFPTWARGGFIGVDVFFVISGFLITTVILGNLERGSFRFAEFYSRRIRRIFPALLLVLVSTYSIGWFVLFADEYKQLGKHVLAGAGFISNFVLWREAGYFDTSAETKPLLHLWSLGVEEQFYIVWPVVLWIAWKKKLNLPTLIFFLALISFALNMKGIRHNSVETFYAPQTRFWELLSGSFLATCKLDKKHSSPNHNSRIIGLPISSPRNNLKVAGRTYSNVVSGVGCILLGIGLWRTTNGAQYPGWEAVLPVLSANLVILGGPQAWFNRKILSNKFFVWFGLISFPLYLWHWPLLSLAEIVESGSPSTEIRLAAVGTSVFLAWVTVVTVEQRVRFGGARKAPTVVLVTFAIIIGLVGYKTYIHNGLAFRTKERESFLSFFENSYPKWQYFKKIHLSEEWRSECAFFDGEKYLEQGYIDGGVADSKPINEIDPTCFKRDGKYDQSVFIWGDSHAQALSPGLATYLPSNWQILQVASSGCVPNPYVDVASPENQCEQSNYFAKKTIREVVPDVVVVAQSQDHSIEAMNEISIILRTYGVKKILFLGPTPRWNVALPNLIARKLWLTKPVRTSIGLNRNVLEKNIELARDFPVGKDSQFVNVIGFFCNVRGCLTRTGHNIKESITTFDDGHLTPSASRYLAQNFLVPIIVED